MVLALPLVPAGLSSIAVQVIDRPILKFLAGDAAVGLYQANYRLGIFMMMAINMFDAAWRPFFIERAKKTGTPEILARVLTYFVLAASFLLLLIGLFVGPAATLALFKGRPLIHPAYWEGLPIVWVVTLGYLFNGIYINMLAPVTIAKKSRTIAYATALGAAVNVASNFILIPPWGLMGAALATLAAYATMAAALFLMGRSLYPVPYEGRRLMHIALGLAFSAGGAYLCGVGIASGGLFLRFLWLVAFPLTLAATGFLREDEISALKRWASRS
jgi:O-antigen/teichoic acid export membrane protein